MVLRVLKPNSVFLKSFALVVGLLMISSSLGGNCVGRADDKELLVDPRGFGFDMAPGNRRMGEGRRAIVQVDDKPVVGRIYVDVGEQRIVLLPDGRLVPVAARDAPETDRPFEPAPMDSLAARWTTGRLNGFSVKKTRHFVFIYNTTEDFALLTSRVLETMVPGLVEFSEFNKLPARDPELPLVVLMFRTEDQFQKFQRMPRGVVAYYEPIENHVVLYEENRLEGVKPELALQQTLATIAHEGTHQILHNIGVQQRLSVWPMWLSEGLAEYLAPTSTGKRLRWKGAGQINDLRMFDLEVFLKSRQAMPPEGQMVEHTVLAARLTSTGYASAWALTHYLAKNERAAFQRYLAQTSRLGPFEGNPRGEPPGIVPGNLVRFREHFGGDTADLEGKLIAHLKRQPYTDPFSEWPHFVAFLSVGSGAKTRREADVFHVETMAERWRQQAIERVPADQRDAVQSAVRSFPNRTTAEAFARQFLQR